VNQEINLGPVVDKLRKGVCRRVTEGRRAVVVDVEGTERFMGSVADIISALCTTSAAGLAERRDNEPLKTDDTGCVTKRFVIFNRPGMAPEKKGGWLKDEHLIDFLREAMLLDCWTAGFRATVLELTWNNDLWASSASEYLSTHDHAIGPRRARKAWREARDKHERIFGVAPSMRLGQEIATYHIRTALPPPRGADENSVLIAAGKLESILMMRSDRPSGPYPRTYKGGFDAAADLMSGWASEALAALKSLAAKKGQQ